VARADYFIELMKTGYDTPLTHDGASLSQGERQLLAIARAAVGKYPVLVLDEATSSIDSRMEQLVSQGLDDLTKDRTVLVVAHRLSTIQGADKIIVLDKGGIAEAGDHKSLIEKKGLYYRLYTGAAGAA
jgi:ATP-binding cassette subfamily B protein